MVAFFTLIFKGRVEWNGLAYSNPSWTKSKDLKKLLCRTIINLFVSRRLLMYVRIDSFRVFWDNFLNRKQPQIRRILHIYDETLFRVFSEYAERMKNTRKEIFTFSCVLKPHGKRFLKNQFRGHIWTYEDQFAIFIF